MHTYKDPKRPGDSSGRTNEKFLLSLLEPPCPPSGCLDLHDQTSSLSYHNEKFHPLPQERCKYLRSDDDRTKHPLSLPRTLSPHLNHFCPSTFLTTQLSLWTSRGTRPLGRESLVELSLKNPHPPQTKRKTSSHSHLLRPLNSLFHPVLRPLFPETTLPKLNSYRHSSRSALPWPLKWGLKLSKGDLL